MRTARILSATAALVVSAATPAAADATAFLGVNTTPANHAVKGIAVGVGLLIVAFEFEYASASEDLASLVPGVKTGSGNVLLQTPFDIAGFQPYFTTGAGLYHETLGTLAHTGFAPNVGGGFKMSLAGPLRLRFDYRVFKLKDGAPYSPAHRIYAGLNLRF